MNGGPSGITRHATRPHGDHGREPPRQRRLRPRLRFGAVASEQARRETGTRWHSGARRRRSTASHAAMPGRARRPRRRRPPTPRWRASPPSSSDARDDPAASRVRAESRTRRTPPRRDRSSRLRWSRGRFRSRRSARGVARCAKHPARDRPGEMPRPTSSRISADRGVLAGGAGRPARDRRRAVARRRRYRAPSPSSTTRTVSSRMRRSRNSVWFLT